MAKKVIIIGGDYDYHKLFTSLGYTIVNDPEGVDLAVFTGGEDVTPSLYGDKKHQHTYNNPRRDDVEANLFTFFRKNNTPMVGICRGAQFLNVMSGGRMYQHVQKHTRSHSITDVLTGEQVYVSSTHHQMMMPSPTALLVATAQQGGEREWFDGEVSRRDISKEDIEVVFYKDTNALCFQPHPEFNSPEYTGMKVYFQSLLVKYLGQ